MKKLSLLAAFILVFTNTAWALFIYDGEYLDVGNLDEFLAYGTTDELGSAGDAVELAWINTTLEDLGLISTYYTMDEFEKIETDGGSGWLQAYSAPGVEADYTFAFNLVTTGGQALFPDYFLVKTGNLLDDIDYRWFLFDNSDLLDWAVINLQEQGYSLLEVGKISHIDGVGGAAPVPEPATLLLLGSGLLGLAGFRKKTRT